MTSFTNPDVTGQILRRVHYARPPGNNATRRSTTAHFPPWNPVRNLPLRQRGRPDDPLPGQAVAVHVALLCAVVAGLALVAHASPAQKAHAQQACLATLDFGSVAECALDTAGEVDSFTFAGVEGDSVRVKTVAVTATLQLTVEIAQPDGTTICRSAANEVTCRLRTSGTHTVRVKCTSRTGTGYYTIYFQRLNNPVGCTPVSYGLAAAGSLDVAGKASCYTFEPRSGDRVRAWVHPTSGSLTSAAIEIVQPNGTTVCEPGIAFSGPSFNEMTCLVVVSGRHTILVSDALSSIYYPTMTYPYPTSSPAT